MKTATQALLLLSITALVSADQVYQHNSAKHPHGHHQYDLVNVKDQFTNKKPVSVPSTIKNYSSDDEGKMTPTTMTSHDALLFVDGLVFGIIAEDIGQEIQQCVITGPSNFIATIETIIKNFQAGGFTNIIKGLEAVYELINSLPDLFTGCTKTGTGIAKLVKWAKIFKDFAALKAKAMQNFLFNAKTIYDEFSSAMSFLKNDDYYNVGLHIGHAIDILTK
eukprot:403356256